MYLMGLGTVYRSSAWQRSERYALLYCQGTDSRLCRENYNEIGFFDSKLGCWMLAIIRPKIIIIPGHSAIQATNHAPHLEGRPVQFRFITFSAQRLTCTYLSPSRALASQGSALARSIQLGGWPLHVDGAKSVRSPPNFTRSGTRASLHLSSRRLMKSSSLSVMVAVVHVYISGFKLHERAWSVLRGFET